MLSDCDAAANKTNADTEYQCYRNQRVEYFLHRKEIHHIADKPELVRNVHDDFSVQDI